MEAAAIRGGILELVALSRALAVAISLVLMTQRRLLLAGEAPTQPAAQAGPVVQGTTRRALSSSAGPDLVEQRGLRLEEKEGGAR